jgi:hypothetical protein
MPRPRRVTADGWRDLREWDPRRGSPRRRWATEPQQIPSAGTWIWPSINGADMADLPGGASGILRRDCKGKEADRPVRASPPAWSCWSRNFAAVSAMPRNWSMGRPASTKCDVDVYRTYAN